jgi:hypothetical protein
MVIAGVVSGTDEVIGSTQKDGVGTGHDIQRVLTTPMRPLRRVVGSLPGGLNTTIGILTDAA